MAIIFPDPSLQTPVNTFSPTSTPDATTNGLTYIWDNALGVWTSAAGGGGGGGVTSVGVTSPLTNSGTATAPVIGIPDATTGTKGAVSVGTNLQVTSGAISVPDASDTTKGVSEIATAAEAATGTDATRTLSPATGVPKALANMTGAAIIPGGDDTARAAITSPTDGMLRYNDTTAPSVMEYYDGSQWVDLATAGSTPGIATTDWYLGTNGNAKAGFTAYGNSRFVTVTGNSGSGNTEAQASTDGGYTWGTPISVSASFSATSFCFANGLFVVGLSGSNRTAVSADGITWTLGAVTANPFGAIAGGNGKFVAIPTGGSTVYQSTDGLNWSTAAFPAGQDLYYGLAYKSGDEYLVCSKDASFNLSLYRSTDAGSTWSATASNFVTSGTYVSTSLVFDGAKYLVVADRKLYTTANGTSPTLVDVSYPTSDNVLTLFTGAGKSFEVSASGTPLVASDDSFSTQSLTKLLARTSGLGNNRGATDGQTIVCGCYVAKIL